jgi:hypothetical protein
MEAACGTSRRARPHSLKYSRTLHGSLVASLLGMTVAIAGTAEGQQALLGPGAAYIAVGTSRISTAELDDRLEANGYPTFGRGASSLGIGGYRRLASGVMIGAEFNGLLIGDYTHQGRDVGLGGGHATIGVGYAKELSPRLRVYPRLGLGAGGLSMWFEDDDADTVDFDDVLADPQPLPARERETVLSRDGLVVDLGGGAELLPRGPSGMMIGVRLGYLVTNFGSRSNWQLYDRTARDGPTASIAGPYVRVMVGLAWSR